MCNKSVLRGGFHSDALSAALSVFFLNTVNTPLSKRSKRGEDVNHAHSARTASFARVVSAFLSFCSPSLSSSVVSVFLGVGHPSP